MSRYFDFDGFIAFLIFLISLPVTVMLGLIKNLPRFNKAIRRWEPLGILIAIIGLGITLWQIQADSHLRRETLKQIEEQRAENKANAIARAWQLITTPASGNSGKKEALEFLHAQKIPLTGLDLSCKTHLGKVDDKGRCNPGVYLIELNLEQAVMRNADLSGADLHSANLSKAELFQANLSNANLRLANLSSASLSGANLSNTNLLRANLSNANLLRANLSNADLLRANLSNANLLWADLSNAYLSSSNLSNADLSSTNLSNADLSEANLSNADLSQATLTKAGFHFAWAWQDQPPRWPEDFVQPSTFKLCKPKLRLAYVKADKTGVPEGC